MESGWLVNSNLSNSEVSAASLPGRSYRISPIALPSGHALLHGRRSTIPHGFGTVCARACSIAKALTSYSTETTYFGHSAAAKSLSLLNHQIRLRELVGWCVKAGLIECDPALAVCAKLVTIEIFFTGNRHCL